MKSKLVFLTMAFLGASVVASASTDPGKGEETKKSDLAGGVIHADTRKPLSNVNVVAYSSNKKEKTAVTDANGNYSFNDLKPGTYKLVFQKDGFKKVTRDKIFIRGDDGCQLNIELSEEEAFLMMPGLLFTEFE